MEEKTFTLTSVVDYLAAENCHIQSLLLPYLGFLTAAMKGSVTKNQQK